LILNGLAKIDPDADVFESDSFAATRSIQAYSTKTAPFLYWISKRIRTLGKKVRKPTAWTNMATFSVNASGDGLKAPSVGHNVVVNGLQVYANVFPNPNIH
jgi:hypothetical protein